MKGCTALIEPSEFDRSKAKLSCQGRDSCAGIGVIARYEHDLPLPLQGWIRSKLCRRQVIERLYETCSDKCLGHDFRSEETLEWQVLRGGLEVFPNSFAQAHFWTVTGSVKACCCGGECFRGN